MTVLHAFIDIKGSILDKYHYMLYFLCTAVETVGQAGRPKTITGFQTHTSPVLLGAKERAELANQEYRVVSSVLEGVVIVEKAPEEEDGEDK